jgi:hypothetical protein
MQPKTKGGGGVQFRIAYFRDELPYIKECATI